MPAKYRASKKKKRKATRALKSVKGFPIRAVAREETTERGDDIFALEQLDEKKPPEVSLWCADGMHEIVGEYKLVCVYKLKKRTETYTDIAETFPVK